MFFIKDKIKKNKIIFIIAGIVLITNSILILKSYNIEKEIEYLKYTTNLKTFVNSPKRLNLESAYGDNQAYHPKVISFKKEWNGYKYWMSYTPYPHADSSKENPHIKVSNNMINWETPKGLTNPLDELENYENGKKYNSDSHLVYNENTGYLECWWRFVDDTDGSMTIYRRKTKDGVKWDEKEEIIKTKRSNEDWISPAIIYENNIYKIWYVNNNKIYYKESKDLKEFSKEKLINIEYEDSVQSWHLDIIHTKKGYEMIIVAYSDWDHRAFMNLYYTFSENNDEYCTAEAIIKPTSGTNYWDNSGMYRSSILYENNQYYIFYSAQGTNNAKGTGLMKGEDIFNLKTEIY